MIKLITLKLLYTIKLAMMIDKNQYTFELIEKLFVNSLHDIILK